MAKIQSNEDDMQPSTPYLTPPQPSSATELQGEAIPPPESARKESDVEDRMVNLEIDSSMWIVTEPDGRASIFPSMERRDEFIAQNTFPNGFSTKRLSSLDELKTLTTSAFVQVPCKVHAPTPPPTPQSNTGSHSKKKVPIRKKSSSLPLVELDEVKRFELFRRVIEHEDDLLNQRVSWIILAQSFLMAAFITSTDGPDSLRYVTATVGLATVIVTLPAIVAAGRNVEVQQRVYFLQLSSDERCQELHGHPRDLKVRPVDEHERRMQKGHIFPNMAFRGRRSIRILDTVLLLAALQIAGWVFLLVALAVDGQQHD